MSHQAHHFNTPLEWTQGEDVTLTFPYPSGVTSLTGASLEWAMAPRAGDTPTLQKSTAGGGVTFDNGAATVTVALTADETTMAAGSYDHDLRRVDGGEGLRLAFGRVKVHAKVGVLGGSFNPYDPDAATQELADALAPYLDVLPSQAGNAGEALTTDGTTASWTPFPTGLPSQTGNARKGLVTNGSAAAWRHPRGAKLFDIRDYGAAVDGSTNDTAAWQAAVAAAAAVATDQAHACVYCPAGTSAVAGTITVPSYVDVVGEGHASQVYAMSLGPIFQLGGWLKDGDAGDAWTSATKYTDLYGILDSSAAPSAGVSVGYDLNDEAYLSLPASPFELGVISADGSNACDHWREQRALTIDVALYNNGSTWTNAAVFGWTAQVNAGLDEAQVAYTPFRLTIESGTVYFRFVTSDGYLRAATCDLGAAASVRLLRLTVQVNLATPRVKFFVNRVAVAEGTTRINLGWAADRNFAPNFHQEFVVGKDPYSAAGAADYVLCGLRFCAGERYNVVAAGQPQVRTDAATLNDLSQFFCFVDAVTFDDSTVCTLQSATVGTSPAPAASGARLVSWFSRTAGINYFGYGHFLPSNFDEASGTQKNRLSGLYLNSAGAAYGSIVHQASALDTQVRNVKFGALGRAWSSLAGQIAYTTRFRDVHTESNGDAAFHFWNNIAVIDGVFMAPRRFGIKAHLGSVGANGVFVNGGGSAVNLVRLSRSNAEFSRWQLDFENGTPADAYFHLTSHTSDYGNPGKAVFRHVSGSSKTAGTPYVRLSSRTQPGAGLPGTTEPAFCRVEDSFDDFTFDLTRAVVEADSPVWQLGFSGSVNPRGLPLAVHADAAGVPRHYVAGDPTYLTLPPLAGDALVPATAGVTYTSLSGVQAVYLADSLGADGSTVAGWNNETGGTDAAAAGAGTLTVKANAWRDLKAVRFPTSYNAYLSLGGLTFASGAATLFFVHVGRQDETHPNPFYLFDNNATGSGGLVQLFDQADIYGGQAQRVTFTAPIGFTVPQVTCLRVAVGTPAVTIWVNRHQAAEAAVPAGANVGWDGTPTLGHAFYDSHFIGDVFAAVLVAGELDDATCLAVQQQLMHDFKIPL